MEIEMKDLLEGTDKGTLVQPAESDISEVIKLLIKNELKEESKEKFPDCCRLLSVILQNIVKNPEEEKFRTIKMSNPKFFSSVGQFPTALIILESLGFEVVHDTEKILIYHYTELQTLSKVAEIASKEALKPIKKVESLAKPEVKKPAVYIRPNQGGKEPDISQQLAEYRSLQKARPGSQRSQGILNQVHQIHQVNTLQPAYTPPPSSHSLPNDPRALMTRIFELVIHKKGNYFRVNQGKQALIWNEDLSIIAWEHSRDMAQGKVPVGHDGYKQRYKRFPFKNKKGGAENVAYNSGFSDPARVCIDAWVSSAPHKKNMLGKFNFTGVGVYVSPQGIFFITQLFALA